MTIRFVCDVLSDLPLVCRSDCNTLVVLGIVSSCCKLFMLIAMLFAFSFRDDDVRFHVAAILVLLDYHYIDFVSVGSCESISYPVSDSGFTLATDTVTFDLRLVCRSDCNTQYSCR